MSEKNREQQPDLGYIDAEGKLRDDGLHDEMLASEAGPRGEPKSGIRRGDQERHEQGYTLVMFPIYILLARMARHRIAAWIITAWCLLSAGLFIALFVRGWWVS